MTTKKSTRPQREESNLPSCAVFTAMDGTLLDFDTFDSRPARPVIRGLQRAGVPIVPMTVMTLEEMAPIAHELGLKGPMVIEAGGAIARWRRGAWSVEQIGRPADVLLDAICEIERITGADLLVYSVLSERDSAKVSGRRGTMLQASMKRRFSEPFLVERGDLGEIVLAAASLGFSVHRGRRFYYLAVPDAEAHAFQQVREEVHCEIAIAAGGSPIDEEFLIRAEIPIIVPQQDGEPDPQLLARVPNVMIAPAPGSAGWAAAIGHVWNALQSAESETARA